MRSARPVGTQPYVSGMLTSPTAPEREHGEQDQGDGLRDAERGDHPPLPAREPAAEGDARGGDDRLGDQVDQDRGDERGSGPARATGCVRGSALTGSG